MFDFVMVALLVAAFAAALGYVRTCAKLTASPPGPPDSAP